MEHRLHTGLQRHRRRLLRNPVDHVRDAEHPPGGRGGISPPRSHRSGREPLDSSGSCHSTSSKRHRPCRAPIAPPTNVVGDRRSDEFRRLLPQTRLAARLALSDPVPSLQPHYRAFATTTNRSAPVLRHQYSAPHGCCRLGVSLSRPGVPRPSGRSFGTTGSRVPHERLNQARATCMPETTWPVNRHPPGSSREGITPPVLISSKRFSTRHQWIAFARLPGSHLTS
jgi:hypothetical protein